MTQRQKLGALKATLFIYSSALGTALTNFGRDLSNHNKVSRSSVIDQLLVHIGNIRLTLNKIMDVSSINNNIFDTVTRLQGCVNALVQLEYSMPFNLGQDDLRSYRQILGNLNTHLGTLNHQLDQEQKHWQ